MTKPDPMQTATTLETARHMAVSGGVKAASLQYFQGGWLLVLEPASGGQCLIKTARGNPRLFKNLDTGAKAAKSLFLPGCYVLLDEWSPDQQALKDL